MTMRSRNSTILAKVESTAGTDSSPTGSADAILVENPSISIDADLVSTNEVTGSLDSSPSITGGLKTQLSFSVVFRGTSAAGTAPRYGRLLEACGWSETTQAEIASEAADDGGTTTAVVADASYGSSDNTYNGMPLTINAAQTFISDYVGSTKTATITDTQGSSVDSGDNITLNASTVYTPQSGTVDTITLYFYQDGIRYIALGCRGSFNVSVDSAGVGRLNFQFSGMYGGKADAALPTVVYDNDTLQPPVFRNATMTIDRASAAVAAVSLDSGNNVVFPGDPNQAEGFGVPEITQRKITGNVDPLEVLVATRDIMTAFRAGTKQIVHARWGSTAGNRIAVTIPNALYTSNNPGDRNGFVMTQNAFEATGENDGAYITIW